MIARIAMEESIEEAKKKAKLVTVDCIDWIIVICMVVANIGCICTCESQNERAIWICCLIWVIRVIFDKITKQKLKR